jgi:hypothetical protein
MLGHVVDMLSPGDTVVIADLISVAGTVSELDRFLRNLSDKGAMLEVINPPLHTGRASSPADLVAAIHTMELTNLREVASEIERL